MTAVVLVPGTWSFRDKNRWDRDGSEFVKFLLSHGVDVVSRRRPFTWSSRIGGLPIPTSHDDWKAAGYHLWDYCDPAVLDVGLVTPVPHLALIAHSHALQVVLYALLFGLQDVDVLVTVGSPIREDMRDVAVKVRPKIKRWVHLYGGKRDKMQWLGELFDGHVGVQREAVWEEDGRVVAKADESIPFEELGHSDLLCDPAQFHYWTDKGALDFLKGKAA